MEAIVVGLVGIVAGTLVAVFGVRAFYVLLPLWGFVSGFTIGAGAVTAVLGDSFLATLAGWVAGIGLGVGLALVATYWFWAAVLVLAGTVGWMAGAGVVAALGLGPGLVVVAAGLAGAVALVLLVLAIDGATLLVAILTAFAGTAAALGGALVLLGAVEVGSLQAGLAGPLRERPLVALGWLVLGTLATLYQVGDARARHMTLRDRLDQPAA